MSRLPAPLAVYALTRQGADSARRLAAGLPGARLFLPRRLADPARGEMPFDRLGEALAANFRSFGGHVLFAAAGIVVRLLAGLLERKDADPAVVVLDPAGRFAVSLLSGHLGGANALAARVAEILGGRAVITTAGDNAGLPGLDSLAAELDLALENLPALARIARLALEGKRPAVYDPEGWLWPALEPWAGEFTRLTDEPGDEWQGPLVWVCERRRDLPGSWLGLRPPCLAAGVGCNRGTPAAAILALLEDTLARFDLAGASLACLATVEAKRDEQGISRAAAELGVPVRYFSSAELATVAVPNPSRLVQGHMGTPSVAEAAAVLATGGGEIMVPKQKTPEATLALARICRKQSST